MEDVKYSKSGHKFYVSGEIKVGNIIKVSVEPLDGYRFVSWSDGNTDNPRYIPITKCDMNLDAIFDNEC